MASRTISKAARAAGVHVETIRYYERRGLIDRPRPSVGSYRTYPDETIRRIRFIKRAQGLGFSLRETRELLTLRSDTKGQCVSVRRRAQEKLREIDARLRELQGKRDALSTLLGDCPGRGLAERCPILKNMDGGGAVRSAGREHR
ncbi:MAG: heavy metal-responsive transcriptional regulator [Planctomycetota bacterium]|jgi:MerR family mercuric resistance operon transcriptional regulator